MRISFLSFLFLASIISSTARAWSQTCIYNGTIPFGNEKIGTAFTDWIYLEKKEDAKTKISMAYISACVDDNQVGFPLMGLRSGINRVNEDTGKSWSAEMSRVGNIMDLDAPNYNCSFFYLRSNEFV